MPTSSPSISLVEHGLGVAGVVAAQVLRVLLEDGFAQAVVAAAVSRLGDRQTLSVAVLLSNNGACLGGWLRLNSAA